MNLRLLLPQLRRAHRRIPRGTEVVGLDLTRLDEMSIDLAVLLCLENRMLGVRDIQLAVVLRSDISSPPRVSPMLDRLRIWRVDDDRLDELSRAAAHARLGEDGWEPATERDRAAALTSRRV